ncbi:OPT superfamily oligopeptide transporter [Metschnikowia bicuspidata var. bicuspidata NRRL YB-4993]|uniref:OPT superfamily oligopeptide transporter n=1 Tax=Metschnikowia bicuspidata var. bicuspidata NRRL YB-4993 TaxID=869754 RepID=A0A1A0H9W3_9ASCO|nr:OPT superfamily oligopeptide transporter [Metschnikowia bicuspidata var. bicuspidata NRRL YB-4993]OBA20919.1 OPT superfamily oligopeptide transporter [Metschnikowia bicuspidata var. bicuspidata NRRL YB-4993]
MDMFYGVEWADWGYQILLIFCTQFMGFGFAGIMRKFAVYPTRALWPSILPTLALNKALLQTSFLYFWLPNYLFEALSYFNWMTWKSPNNATLAVVTGSIGGLALNPLTTFDWNIIDFNGALTIPFFSQVNQYTGSILAFFCILGLWYSNYKWTGYLPINSNSLFTNTGEVYSVSSILNSDNLIDQAKYESYSPPFYTAANMVVYGAFFAIYPFTILYMGLTHWTHNKFAIGGLYSAIRNFKRSTYEGYHDAYSKSMRKYKEVPEWCFFIVLVISIVFAILPWDTISMGKLRITSQIRKWLTTCFISLAVINFNITNIKDYCDPNQSQRFTCPSARTFYSASVIWGVIGPERVFSHLYPILKWCFLIGFLLAPLMFLIKKYFSKYQAVRYFEPVLVIGGFLIYAPYNLSYFTPGVIASFFFMHVIRNRYINWFKKYVFLLSGSLNAGLAFSSIIIFFAVQYNEKYIDWWGNNVPYAGLDASSFSNLDASTAPDGYFDPRKGNYP